MGTMKFNSADREKAIAETFPDYEDARRTEHLHHALRRFPTGALEQEHAKLMASARHEARSRYDPAITESEQAIARLRRQIAPSSSAMPAAPPSRNAKAELSLLYDELRMLRAEIDSAHLAKQAAYQQLDSAKHSINSWHNKSRRSPLLFGNGGRTLPKHSMFGQSMGDLAGYKAARANAVRDIANIKRQLETLIKRRSELQDQIAKLKNARQCAVGVAPNRYPATSGNQHLPELQVRLQHLLSHLTNLRSERAQLLDAARYRTGAIEIERVITNLKLRRDDFLASFDTPEAKAARYAAHVERWLNAHGS